MAIFNMEFLIEAGISSDNRSDPKFRKEQYKKVMKIVHDAINSIPFKKDFTAIPTICEYNDSDDDAQYCLGRWIAGHNKVLGIASFDRKDVDSGSAKDSANYIIKYFNNQKATDKKLFGNLKISKYDGSIDFSL